MTHDPSFLHVFLSSLGVLIQGPAENCTVSTNDICKQTPWGHRKKTYGDLNQEPSLYQSPMLIKYTMLLRPVGLKQYNQNDSKRIAAV